jgi:hypothetical protein
MASRLQKIREYWQATADTGQKLVEPKPKPKAVVLRYESKVEKVQPDLAEVIYERACMLACDMQLPFEWADAIVKLRSIKKPLAIPQSSWLEINAACIKLYMDDFALLKVIISNDWATEDIYGCNKFAPLVRVDCMGLLLLLHQGDEVVGVNKERIKILRRSGKVNYLYKKLDQQMKVDLLYEL